MLTLHLWNLSLRLCKKDLNSIMRRSRPILAALRSELQAAEFCAHHNAKSKFDVYHLCADFVDALLENMEARLPLTDLLFSFSVLSMLTITFLSEAELTEEMLSLWAIQDSNLEWIWWRSSVHFYRCDWCRIDPEGVGHPEESCACRTLPQKVHIEIVEPHIAVAQQCFPHLVILAQLGLTLAVNGDSLFRTRP